MKHISLISFLLGIISFILKMVIGTTVDSNGMLQEPFFLIPLGYLFLLIGVVTGAIYLYNRHKENISR